MMNDKEPTTRTILKNLKPTDHLPVEGEELRPDQLAALLEGEADPFRTLQEAGRQCGLDEKVIGRMVTRIRSQFQPVLSELRKVQTGELLNLLEDRAERALLYMDDYALSKASAKDLAVIAGIMLEKRALLRGEPTQILSIEDRKSMDTLIPQVLEEAQKRGMFVDVLEGMVDVTPGYEGREARPRARMPLKTRKQKVAQARKEETGEP